MRDIQNQGNFTRNELLIGIGLFTFLYTYLIIRCIYVPVLHDELATFFYYIQPDNYMPPKAHWDANNHILNSMLSNWSYHLFGSSPLSLRLPNLIAYAAFFYASFQIAARLKSRFLRWGLLLAFVSSHYLFEYFGEARGYGMSIAFFTLAIFQFIRLKETDQMRRIGWISIFLFLGTSANLTLIIPSILIFSVLVLFTIIPLSKAGLKKSILHLLLIGICALPFILLVLQSFALKERGALYYGGHSGFYEITVRSVTFVFTDFYNLGIAVGLTLLFIGLFIYLLTRTLQKKSLSTLFETAGFMSYLMLASVFCILILSYFLSVNFPEDRAAMHLFILFAGALAFVLDDLGNSAKKVTYFGILLFYFPALFIVHFSPTKTVFSSEERTPYDLYAYVQNTPQNFKFPTLVGGYKTQEFCWYYMSNRDGGNAGKIHTNFHIALDADFQVIRDVKLTDSTIFKYYVPVLSDPATKLTLFERKKKLMKEEIYVTDVYPTNGLIEDEFHNILEIDIDSLRGQLLYIGAEMTLLAESKPFISWLAVTVNDSVGTSLYQEYIALDWLRKNCDGTTNNLLQGTLLHNIPAEATVLKFYIWNIDKTRFSIPNGKCYLYRLERDFPTQD